MKLSFTGRMEDQELSFGHTSVKCQSDTQVEMLNQQFDTCAWSLREKSKLDRFARTSM